MYKGQLFLLSWRYAVQQGYEIRILSAKYGMLRPETIIDPYDMTLRNFSKNEVLEWSDRVKQQMVEDGISSRPHVFLTGKLYCKHFKGEKPLKGLGMGYRMQWLKKHLKKRSIFDG